jgi:hypothetical protein
MGIGKLDLMGLRVIKLSIKCLQAAWLLISLHKNIPAASFAVRYVVDGSCAIPIKKCFDVSVEYSTHDKGEHGAEEAFNLSALDHLSYFVC